MERSDILTIIRNLLTNIEPRGLSRTALINIFPGIEKDRIHFFIDEMLEDGGLQRTEDGKLIIVPPAKD